MLYDKVKYGDYIYELKQKYDADYIVLNIEWAIANQNKDDMVRGILENYEGNDFLRVDKCPLCGEMYHGYPAISRYNSDLRICPTCGLKEALEIYQKNKEN